MSNVPLISVNCSVIWNLSRVTFSENLAKLLTEHGFSGRIFSELKVLGVLQG